MGGVLFNMQGTATLVNSTLADDSAVGGQASDTSGDAQGVGGAIFNLNGSVSATNTTIVGDNPASGGTSGFGGSVPATTATSGGLYDVGYDAITDRNASATLNNTIAWASTDYNLIAVKPSATTAGSNISGAVIAGANDDGSFLLSGGSFSLSDFNNLDPLLGPLQDNGGGMETEVPAADSPILGIGTACPALDQRGLFRPATACDIGAVQTVGAATHLGVSVNSSAAAGNTVPVTVTAYDTNGNAATGDTDTVQLTSSDPAATLPADVTLANGIATFNVVLKTIGTQTITATDSTDDSITGASAQVSVSPAPTNGFTVSGPASATTVTPVTFTVTAMNQLGETASGYSGTVHFTSSDPDAVLPADTTLTDGTGSFQVTFATAGPQTVTVTDTASSSITGMSSGVAVSAPTPPPTSTQTTPTPTTGQPAPTTSTGTTPPPTTAPTPVPEPPKTKKPVRIIYGKPKYDGKTGVVTLKVKLSAGGQLAALEMGADTLLTHPAKGKGHKPPKRTKNRATGRKPGAGRFSFATGSATVSRARTVTLKLKPNAYGKLAAKQNPRRFRLSVVLVYRPKAGGKATTSSLSFQVKG